MVWPAVYAASSAAFIARYKIIYYTLEYGLPWYSDKHLKMIDGMWIKWSDKYSSQFVNGRGTLDVKNSYDDIIERLVKGNEY